jgi:hypothetical protein
MRSEVQLLYGACYGRIPDSLLTGASPGTMLPASVVATETLRLGQAVVSSLTKAPSSLAMEAIGWMLTGYLVSPSP